VFKAWKGAGEPWVRYYGVPVEMNASNNAAQYGDWFDSPRFRVSDAEGNNLTSYTPYSQFQQQMIIGRSYNFQLPKAPGEPVTQVIDPRPWYGLYMGGAEVNLYLAEFKLLGANLPKSAEEYLTKGMTLSVQEYDKLAGLNQIAYYGANGWGATDESGAARIERIYDENGELLSEKKYDLTRTLIP
jgi:hypothetical protein